jgi:hypothetical protein
MTTLGIVADTHVPQRLAQLPDRLADALRGVDLILHAGDITSRQVLIDLEKIAPVQAVAGNADLVGHGLPLTRVIDIAGRRIGLVHGHGGWAKYLAGKVRDRLGYREEYYLKIVAASFGRQDRRQSRLLIENFFPALGRPAADLNLIPVPFYISILPEVP